MPVFELVYVSRAQIDLTHAELEAFLGPSRVRNAGSDVTGVLLHVLERTPSGHPYRFVEDEDDVVRQSFFVQLLEGEQEEVEQTFERIQRDELHHEITVLSRLERPARSCQGWHLHWLNMTAQAVLAHAEEVGRHPRELTALLRDADFVRSLLLRVAQDA